MQILRDIIGDYDTFLDCVLKELTEAGFDLHDFVQVDHICYRVASQEAYRAKRQQLHDVGTLIGDSMINGRPISTFRLTHPLYRQGWRIDTIELPAPKNNGAPYTEGLEHIGAVLYDDLQDFLKKYPGKPFSLHNANAAINPEITYALPTYRVKFHRLNLPTVVYLEKKFHVHTTAAP